MPKPSKTSNTKPAKPAAKTARTTKPAKAVKAVNAKPVKPPKAQVASSAKFFDDPDEGPAKATSHPNFRAVCKDALFYDVGDEFGPFGNDSGSDTLANLADWLRPARPKSAMAFLKQQMADWGFDLRHAQVTDPAKVLALEADPDVFLTDLDQAIIATAFGQYKITGAVEAEVHALALRAIERAPIVTAHWEARNPAWPHAKAQRAATAKIRAALLKMRQ